MTYSIVDLLLEIGLKEVRLQPLLGSLCSASTNKKGETKITFATKEVSTNDLLFDGKTKVGIVLWLPKPELDAITARFKARGHVLPKL